MINVRQLRLLPLHRTPLLPHKQIVLAALLILGRLPQRAVVHINEVHIGEGAVRGTVGFGGGVGLGEVALHFGVVFVEEVAHGVGAQGLLDHGVFEAFFEVDGFVFDGFVGGGDAVVVDGVGDGAFLAQVGVIVALAAEEAGAIDGFLGEVRGFVGVGSFAGFAAGA